MDSRTGVQSAASRLYQRAQTVFDVLAPHAAPNDVTLLDTGAVPYSAWSTPLVGNASTGSSASAVKASPGASQRLCKNREGWGPVSQLRDLDLTPCAADAYLLAIPSVIFACFGE